MCILGTENYEQKQNRENNQQPVYGAPYEKRHNNRRSWIPFRGYRGKAMSRQRAMTIKTTIRAEATTMAKTPSGKRGRKKKDLNKEPELF